MSETISAEDKSLLERLRAFFNGSQTDPLEQLRNAKEALDLQLSAITKERDDSITNLNAVTKERDDLTAKVTGLETDLKTVNEGMTAKIETEVTNRIAAAGGDPIKRDPKLDAKTAMTREEFSALSPADKSNFCRSGGSITG